MYFFFWLGPVFSRILIDFSDVTWTLPQRLRSWNLAFLSSKERSPVCPCGPFGCTTLRIFVCSHDGPEFWALFLSEYAPVAHGCFAFCTSLRRHWNHQPTPSRYAPSFLNHVLLFELLCVFDHFFRFGADGCDPLYRSPPRSFCSFQHGGQLTPMGLTPLIFLLAKVAFLFPRFALQLVKSRHGC